MTENRWALSGKQAGTLQSRTASKQRRKRQEKFVKGPVPMWWLEKAHALGGAALFLGLILFHKDGLPRFASGAGHKLSNAYCEACGISVQAKRRAIKALSEAGLINIVSATNHASPVVELVRTPSD